jgi:transcription antitermination factor NusG
MMPIKKARYPIAHRLTVAADLPQITTPAPSPWRDLMPWYVLVTRPHHERVVYDRLVHRGVAAYLPLTSRPCPATDGPRHPIRPLFPRYVWVRCVLDCATELALISLPGVVRLLDDGRGQLVLIPEEEIRRLQRWSAGGVVPAWATSWLEQTFRQAVSPGHERRWTLAPARMTGVAWPASRRGTFSSADDPARIRQEVGHDGRS